MWNANLNKNPSKKPEKDLNIQFKNKQVMIMMSREIGFNWTTANVCECLIAVVLVTANLVDGSNTEQRMILNRKQRCDRNNCRLPFADNEWMFEKTTWMIIDDWILITILIIEADYSKFEASIDLGVCVMFRPHHQSLD